MNFLERSIKMGPFLVSVLGEIFFRTGCQFGVPGGTYPPKKYPSAPPPPGISITVQREHTIEKKVLIL